MIHSAGDEDAPEDAQDVSEDDSMAEDDSSAENDSSAEDVEDLFEKCLWDLLCRKCLRYDWSIYQCIYKHLEVYYEQERDVPYQKIMEDVEKEESEGSSFIDALERAIQKNESLIRQSIQDYGAGKLFWEYEPPNIWRLLNVPSKCFCKAECNCQGSPLKKFKVLVRILHAMEYDDLIGDIIDAVTESELSRDIALETEIKARQEEIVSKFKQAKEELEELGQDEKTMTERWEEKGCNL